MIESFGITTIIFCLFLPVQLRKAVPMTYTQECSNPLMEGNNPITGLTDQVGYIGRSPLTIASAGPVQSLEGRGGPRVQHCTALSMPLVLTLLSPSREY